MAKEEAKTVGFQSVHSERRLMVSLRSIFFDTARKNAGKTQQYEHTAKSEWPKARLRTSSSRALSGMTGTNSARALFDTEASLVLNVPHRE